MKVKDLQKFDETKDILIDGGGEVYEVEVDHESDFAIWLKLVSP